MTSKKKLQANSLILTRATKALKLHKLKKGSLFLILKYSQT